jgi:hypothetical protein
MDRPSDKGQRALARIEAADREESHRGLWWGLLSRCDKVRALQVAHLDKSRAVDALSTFTPEERAQIRGAVVAHIAKMQLVAQLMGVSEVAALAPSKFH